MPQPLSKSSKIFITILLVVAAGLAVAYVVYRYSHAVGFYEMTDMLREEQSGEITTVYFVRVADYDSLNVRGVAEDLTRKTLDSGAVNPATMRRFLYHVYATSDTAELTKDMLDELAYTNPEIVNPTEKLRVVRNGWMVQYVFAPNRVQPREFTMRRTYFYIPKTGIRAKDLQ
ncbi:MAG: hypothetical protein RL594_1119 [Bacteroidota bacterium]|jgi:hypothetical protein